jgi:hypothetical protein
MLKPNEINNNPKKVSNEYVLRKEIKNWLSIKEDLG